jgi:hypothetical protein
MYKLKVNGEGVTAREFSLSPGQHTIGRNPESSFCLDHPSVSGCHGEFIVQDCLVHYQDRNSTNGSFLNGHPIQQVLLQAGNILQLGEVKLHFEEAAAVTTPAPSGSRLKLNRAAAPPPNLAEASPGMPMAEIPCRNHPSTPAALACQQCGTLFCEACISSRQVGKKVWRTCPVCQGQCVSLADRQKVEAEGARTFFSVLPSAFKYPFVQNGLILLIAGTIMFSILDGMLFLSQFFRKFLWLFTGLTYGYLFAYMQRILVTSSQGENEPPDWPDLSDWWDDIWRPFFMFTFTVALSLGPALGYLIWAASSEADVNSLVLLPLIAFGVLYFPMALMAVCIADSVVAANPFLVLSSIARIPLEYLVASGVFFSVVVLRYACETGLKAAIPFPLVPGIISAFVALYFVMVEMRILGLMHLKTKKRLRWSR